MKPAHSFQKMNRSPQRPEIATRFRAGAWQRMTIAGFAALLSLPVPAEEVAPFRLTSVDGEVAVRYYFDEQMSGTSGASKSGETRSTVEEEVFIRTRGYVYHPNLLKVELGGGPLLVQSRVAAGGLTNQGEDVLYNLTTRLDFLEQKPYPVSLYYEHLNPSVYTSTTSRFLQENNKLGVTASLRRPGAKTNYSVDASHATSKGQSIEQVVNDETEQAAFSFDHTLGSSSNGQFLYQVNRQQSRSGSVGTTILPTTSETDSLNYSNKIQFGKNKTVGLNNVIVMTDQKFTNSSGTIKRKDLRYTPDLRWQHSEKTDSYYRANYVDSEDNGTVTNNRSVTAGINQRPSDVLTRSADVTAEDNRTTGLVVRAGSVGANIKYLKKLEQGEMRLGYGARYDQRDQQAAVSQIPVVGEQITLTGATGVALSRDYVVTGTIVVSNLARTQTYASGTDYRVVVLGARTEIERLAGGAILDGQQVLVDYEFQTGGSLGYTMLNQNLQASATLRKYFNVYASINSAMPNIYSGATTLPLNSGTSWSTGARADLPLKNDFRVGGEIIHDNYQENITPYIRDSIEAYVEMPLPFLSTMRLSARNVRVDNIGSSEDVDLNGFIMRFRSRPWFRANLTVELNMEEDTGGTLQRKLTGAVATLSWRIRRLLFGAEARTSREAQGNFERDRTLLRLYLTREIL